jgi:undecaprenyl phosphate-alpha-L-ara4FN deformylase
MLLAVERFREVFGTEPAVHGAAGWQMNETALAFEQELGFLYASDTRGVAPFVPQIDGQRSRCPQLPTTLPTLDELIGIDGIGVERVHESLLARTREPCPHHVFTLHAELEGMKLLPVLRRLLAGWRDQGYQLVSMRTLLADLDVSTLPSGLVRPGTVPGRSGLLAVQAMPQPV